jgi:hypothetical protein
MLRAEQFLHLLRSDVEIFEISSGLKVLLRHSCSTRRQRDFATIEPYSARGR